jgi:hypothetical protein
MEGKRFADADCQTLLDGIAYEIRSHLMMIEGFTSLVQEKVEAQHPAATDLACLKAAVDKMQLFSKMLTQAARDRRKATIATLES